MLNLARSNVSNGLKELRSLGLVKSRRKSRDPRDHFTSIRDMFDLVSQVIESRREREYAPTLVALRDVQAEAEPDATPPAVKARTSETLNPMRKETAYVVFAEFLARPRALGPRCIINPAAFFIALIGGPALFTFAPFWMLFIPVASLGFGGHPYPVIVTPVLLLHLSRIPASSITSVWVRAARTAAGPSYFILVPTPDKYSPQSG